jgi:transcriptional regulator with XRE-family HTH domain
VSTRDEEFSELLREALRLEKRAPVTEADVEEFLSAPGDDDPESVERVRALAVERAFLLVHRRPVRQILDFPSPSFGAWITAARKKARLPRRQVAMVLKQDPGFMERLESGETPPWHCDADTVAALVKLYRVNINAVERLIRSTDGSELPPAPPPSRVEPRGDGMQTYMVDRSGGYPNPELRPEVVQWLSELRAALKRLRATDLLRY